MVPGDALRFVKLKKSWSLAGSVAVKSIWRYGPWKKHLIAERDLSRVGEMLNPVRGKMPINL